MTVSTSLVSQQTVLPPEILTLVMSTMSLRQLEVARQVCKEWHEIANTIIVERLYGTQLACSIPNKADFFIERKKDFLCKMIEKKSGCFFKFQRKHAYSVEKTINPFILSFQLRDSSMTGAEFIEFASAHPKLMNLTLKNCKKITYSHLIVAFSHFENLRSVTVSGEKMFDPELLTKLSAHNPDLERLKIRDSSGPLRSDEMATRVQTRLKGKLKLLEIDLPNKSKPAR